MAITEIYVDPALAADSGAGTIGDPYGDLEYAIVQETLDTVNGTRVNVKSGTDEILVADLDGALTDTSVSIAWVPTLVGPLYIQGYTSTAGDGGIGGISGGGSVGVLNNLVLDYITLVHLHCHNVGTNSIIEMDRECSVIYCELDDGSGSHAVKLDQHGILYGCYIHNYDGYGVNTVSHLSIEYNYFKNGSRKFSYAIQLAGNGTASRNLIHLDSTSSGITLSQGRCTVNHNAIYSDGGTGVGIRLASSRQVPEVSNNLVEGFSGSGGIGFHLSVAGSIIGVYSGNSAFNNETNFNNPTFFGVSAGNEVLTTSPFRDPANGNFAPNNVGLIKEGALPQVFANGAI